MEIKQATDWQTVSTKIRRELTEIKYNPDLYKMLKNIDAMVTEISKLEVIYRRTISRPALDAKLADANKAITHLEKLILMAKLMN
jgi:hypothetical protein